MPNSEWPTETWKIYCLYISWAEKSPTTTTATTKDSSHLVKQIINIKSKLHKFKNNKTKTCLHKLINKSIPKSESKFKSECENEYESTRIRIPMRMPMWMWMRTKALNEFVW